MGKQQNIWAVVLLVALTAFAYAPVAHYGFLNYDDPQYVTHNPNVTAGLTWQGLKWAFNIGYQSNWHPLTWLSHMLDVQLFGANAGAHHLTNVVLHIANILLLFWFLLKVTRSSAHSALIAAFFAIHPVHVESVAWVSERKDVLSTFFGMLTLCAYAIYASRPRRSTYFAVLGLFALSLMAKPMLVTLPFVLLLLDFWPLRRFTLREASNIRQLVREKIPLLALSSMSSFATYLAQQKGGSVVGVDAIPVAARVANAFVAYFDYLQRIFWPARLAVLYPAVLTARDWWWLAALGVLGISILSIRAAERRPYFPVGWFWYLGTLVPVIGFIQVGRQATADRYTYVPLIGISIIAVFGISEAHSSLSWRKYIFVIAGGAAIGACLWRTRTQLEYWASSRELWAHALEITSENELAQFNLAAALQDEGKVDEAIVHFSEAARIEPHNANAQYSFASILIKNHRSLDEAATHLAQAMRDQPDFAEAHDALGIDYLIQGKLDRAAGEFAEAIRLKPDYASAHNNLGTVLGNQGQIDHAISEYAEAVRLDPSLEDARINLGILLAKRGR
jgi:tetratricopeptide (TPR) repeat protein